MPFAATVEVERFDEAADWFLKRIVMTGEQAAGLTGRAATDSFWVGAGLQLHQVQSVFDKISKAIESGEPFAEWRAKVRDELRSDAHAETVFRNAVQRAYNAGRWEQMRKDDVVRFRPFWLYDSILDSRTTEVCKICNGTLLPADDPFWSTHVPPLHHRCRSSIRNLRRSEAERRGISKGAPDTSGSKPKGDWGLPPTAPGWKPDLTKVDPKLKPKVEKKAKKREEKPVPPMKATPKPKAEPKGKKPKAPKVAPEHTYEFWLEHYRPKYGMPAAKSVAWGRMSMEVGLDMRIAAAEAQLSKLANSSLDGPFAGYRDLLHRAKRDYLRANNTKRLPKTLRELGDTPEGRAAATLAGHLSRVEPRASKLVHTGATNGRDVDRANLNSVLRGLDALSGQRIKHPTAFRIEFRPSRAHADIDGKALYVPDGIRHDAQGTIAHEWTHAVEMNGDLAERASGFRAARARSTETKRLKDLTGREEFRDNEMAYEGDYLDAYVGKKYGFRVAGDSEPTEVSSMAVQTWFDRRMVSTMKIDPEFGWFGLGQLSGHDLPHGPSEYILEP